MKRIVAAAACILLLGGLAAGGWWIYARSATPRFVGEWHLAEDVDGTASIQHLRLSPDRTGHIEVESVTKQGDQAYRLGENDNVDFRWITESDVTPPVLVFNGAETVRWHWSLTDDGQQLTLTPLDAQDKTHTYQRGAIPLLPIVPPESQPPFSNP